MRNNRLVFDSQLIAKMGIFTALSFVLTYAEFPIFPNVDFLKLDFSNVFVLIGGFSLGAIPGVIILTIKEALCLLKSTTLVGQLANLLIGLAYILVPLILYKYKRSFKTAVLGLLIGVVLQSSLSLLINYYVNYPLYISGVIFLTTPATNAFFETTWVFILLFNVIKAVSTAVITLLLYKRVKKALKI